MCGRYTLQESLENIAEIFDAEIACEAVGPRYNIAPTERIPVVAGSGADREVVAARWGLVPHWSRDPARVPLLINARAESLASRPAFRDLLEDRRCVIPADGFYEWRTEEGLRQPYLIRRVDGGLLSFAGLWDSHPTGGAARSCAIITTGASPLLAPLHDRMPVILEEHDARRWLDIGRVGFQTLRPALAAYGASALEAVPVSRRVNRAGLEEPGLLEPLADPVRDPADWESRPGPGGPESRRRAGGGSATEGAPADPERGQLGLF